jgi:hypothetical protein
LSDELQVLGATGGPVFDYFIPENAANPVADEPPLVFQPGFATPQPLGFDPGAAMTNGAQVTLLLDPVGEPQDPGETQIPINIPGTSQTYFLSDAVVSTLNLAMTNTAYPPQVALFSDPSRYLLEIATDLPNAPLPPKIEFETGSLQATNALDFNAAPQYGLVAVNVASDVEVPEPATMALVGIASIGLLARRRRMV